MHKYFYTGSDNLELFPNKVMSSVQIKLNTPELEFIFM